MRTVLLLVCASVMTAAQPSPFIPRDGTTVLATVAPRSDSEMQAIRALRARVQRVPGDTASAAELARRHIELGRLRADPRHYGQAQAALAPWWHEPAPPPEIQLLRASLLQTAHQFNAALRDLDALTHSAPQNPQVWLTRAAVLSVQARYPEALASCARLSHLAPDVVAYACLAAASPQAGIEAEKLLESALARAGKLPPATEVWVDDLLAELAERRHDSSAADRHFQRAIALAPHDSFTLANYADFLLRQDRAAAAMSLLVRETQADVLLLRYALALKRIPAHRAELAARIQDLDARFAAIHARGDESHAREEAIYQLHLCGDAAKALRLARLNWEMQKESADARILLEAARAAGQPDAARPVVTWVRSQHVHDPSLVRLAAQWS